MYENINRSLNFSEYEIQRICNFLKLKHPPISDFLVSKFPGIKSAKLKCNSKTYNLVKEKNQLFLEKINNFVNNSELFIIEDKNDVVYTKDEIYNSFLSKEQIELISEYLKKKINSI